MIEAMKEMVDNAALAEGAGETEIANLHKPDAVYTTPLVAHDGKELGQYSRTIHRFPGKGGDRAAWVKVLPDIREVVKDSGALGMGMSTKNALYSQTLLAVSE
jgi:hypothetical protein